MIDPVETAELLAFVRIVEAKSLARAAAELGAPRATISRRLARLEERLDVRLLRRTTRSLALTDAGESFYQHARLVLDAVQRAEASVRTTLGDVRGSVRASFPPMRDIALRSMICEFAAAHPDVRLHLDFSTRHVDLQRDGYDVALRASTRLEPGLMARTFARSATIAVASPAYLASKGTPRSARELRDHRCLMGFERGELPQTHWPLRDGGRIALEGAFFSNDIQLLLDAAIAGLGIALLPLLMLGSALADGRLVHVLPGEITIESRIAVVFPERELVPPQVRAFIDALSAWLPGKFDAAAAAKGDSPERATTTTASRAKAPPRPAGTKAKAARATKQKKTRAPAKKADR